MKKYELLKRFPPLNDIIPVFAFTALLVYGRMFYILTWKLPSWLKFLTLNEILSIVSYAFSVNFLETAAYVLLLLVISFLLPAAWFRNVFIVRSAWAVFVWFVSLMVFFQQSSNLGLDLITAISLWLGGTLVLVVLAAFAAPRLRLMRSVALWFADRAIVFLFIFLPVSLVSMIAVAVRNLF